MTGEGSETGNRERERRGITASAEELSQPITLLKEFSLTNINKLLEFNRVESASNTIFTHHHIFFSLNSQS